MGRPRKNQVSIDEAIRAQEDMVAKAKAKYDAVVGKLKDLLAKRDEMTKKELFSAVEKNSKNVKFAQFVLDRQFRFGGIHIMEHNQNRVL